MNPSGLPRMRRRPPIRRSSVVAVVRAFPPCLRVRTPSADPRDSTCTRASLSVPSLHSLRRPSLSPWCKSSSPQGTRALTRNGGRTRRGGRETRRLGAHPSPASRGDTRAGGGGRRGLRIRHGGRRRGAGEPLARRSPPARRHPHHLDTRVSPAGGRCGKRDARGTEQDGDPRAFGVARRRVRRENGQGMTSPRIGRVSDLVFVT